MFLHNYDGVIRNCTLTDNDAPTGGALHIEHESSAPQIDGCTFQGNQALRGAAIGCSQGSGSFSDCVIYSNAASYSGGAVYCTYAETPLEFTDCMISVNTAQGNHGGGFYFRESYLAMFTDCTINNNSAGQHGGGIYLDDSYAQFERCTLASNSAASNGGALYLDASALDLAQSTLNANGAAGYGGGISALNSIATIVYTVVAFGTDGEAYYREGLGGDDPVLGCCDIYGNDGGDWVGCIASQLGQDGNFSADPMYCPAGMPGQDPGIHALSPCAPGVNPECGWVGAWPVACGGGARGLAEDKPTASDAPVPTLSFRAEPTILSGADGSAAMNYAVPSTARTTRVRLSIYATDGRLVQTLIDAPQAPGSYRVVWNGSHRNADPVPAGVYCARLTVGDQQLRNRILVLR